MKYDFAAQSVNDVLRLIEKLAKQEQEVEDARRAGDRDRRQMAEKKAQEKRLEILRAADPSIVYLHLSAIKVANDVEFRSTWQKKVIKDKDIPSTQLRTWHLDKLFERHFRSLFPGLSFLPPGSWFLQFQFTLAKPYISKDDNPFYIIDNPIVRDKVFRLPMVRPSSWKGNLRSALWQLGYQEDDEVVRRLFGETRGKEGESWEELGQSGRLIFFPTFFTEIGLEIINPHDRKRRVGKNPILFESVPIDAKGTFSLLYLPFDLIGQPEGEIKKQAAEHLQRVAEGLQAMFLTYGFSAKRTSGYGVAKESVANGFVQLGIEETATPPVAPPPAAEPQPPKYLQAPGKLKDEYLNPDGTFHERSQAELAKMSKSQRQEYEKARKWWEREGKALTEGSQAQPAPEEPSAPPQPHWLKRSFASFEELVEVSKSLAEQLAQGGER